MENRDFLRLADGQIVKFQVYLQKFINKSKYIPLPRNQFIGKLMILLYFKIIRKIHLFISLILDVKLVFNLPERKKNIIIDGSMHHYTKFLTKNNNVHILETRINLFKKIYVTKEIIFFLIKNFNKNSLKINYLIILIKIIKPENVLTLIDNSFDFFILAKNLHKDKINFFAFQNATRRNESASIIKKRFIPNYFTFSKYEKKLFKKSNNVKKFFSIGSIKALIAKKNFLNKKLNKKKFDLCLISEPEININPYQQANSMDNDLALIFDNCLKYSKKYRKKIIIIGKSNYKNTEEKLFEIEFYKNFISKKRFKIFFHDKEKFEGYKKIYQSKVVVGGTSSLLREAFEFDKKVLHCKYIKDKGGNLFPSEGICTLRKKGYKEFERRLNKILKMSYSNYLKNIKNVNNIYFKRNNIIEILHNKFN